LTTPFYPGFLPHHRRRIQHLVFYYKSAVTEPGFLRTPYSVLELATLDTAAEYVDDTYFRIPPGQDTGKDGRMICVSEAEDEGGVGGGGGSGGGGGTIHGGGEVIGGRVLIDRDMKGMPGIGMPSTLNMSSVGGVGGRSSRASRKGERMEPRPTLQDLVDCGIVGIVWCRNQAQEEDEYQPKPGIFEGVAESSSNARTKPFSLSHAFASTGADGHEDVHGRWGFERDTYSISDDQSEEYQDWTKPRLFARRRWRRLSGGFHWQRQVSTQPAV
jgi:hypothetical protein